MDLPKKEAAVEGQSQEYPSALIESAEALTQFVSEGQNFEDTMQRLAELAVHAMEGADRCSISLVTGTDKQLKNVAATDERARGIDDLQSETREGPCLASIEDQATFHIADMEQHDLWPEFCKRAADETDTQSMLCYVLRLSDEATGAMNMISSDKGAFTDDDLDTGTIFAAQAALAMTNALNQGEDQQEIEQLKAGLKTRQMIGQAVGILMASRQVDADAAFAILTKVSQTSNVKIRNIAEQVVNKAADL